MPWTFCGLPLAAVLALPMPGPAGTPPAAPPAAAAVTCTLKSGKILIIPAAQHPASLGEEVQQLLSLRRLQQQSQAHCNPISERRPL